MKIILKKACSCLFYAEIKANDVNGCYQRRLMVELGILGISLQVTICIRQ